ncbi:NAD(P)-dependent oxidoreductase [Streptomyces badius]
MAVRAGGVTVPMGPMPLYGVLDRPPEPSAGTLGQVTDLEEGPGGSAELPDGPAPRCLVTGATGYIGGRLVPALLDSGYRVRALARTPQKLRDYPWADRVEVVRGDVTDAGSLAEAMRGVDVAYYLVHALGTGSSSRRPTAGRPGPSASRRGRPGCAGSCTWAG